MDSKNEDTMVRQIETNLSNNINDNLFLTGRMLEGNKATLGRKQLTAMADDVITADVANQNYPLVSNDFTNHSVSLSRAEYIRQAREACLRQLSAVQIYSKPYDSNYMDAEEESNDQLNQKKAKVMKLFHNDTEEETEQSTQNTVNGLGIYRSIIIRCVCAILIFASIFMIDKFNVKIGNVTNKTIKEYVMGNDVIKDLENIIVTWLK